MNSASGKSQKTVALICLGVAMIASLYFSDIFSALSRIFSQPETIQLGWDTASYGLYSSGYSVLCVFGALLMGGIFIDLYGERKVGSMAMLVTVFGAIVIYFALSSSLSPQSSLVLSYTGNIFLGLGTSITLICIISSIFKWFREGNINLAAGICHSIAVTGSALALFLSPVLAGSPLPGYSVSPVQISRVPLVGLAFFLLSFIAWTLFLLKDSNFDKTEKRTARISLGNFKFNDITKACSDWRFISLSLIGALFFSCVIGFKKFCPLLVAQPFDGAGYLGKWMTLGISLFSIVFAPLTGYLAGKTGKSKIWIILGSVILLTSQILLRFGPQSAVNAFICTSLLGVAFCFVPTVIWVEIARMSPEKYFGSYISVMLMIQSVATLGICVYTGFDINSDFSFVAMAALATLLAAILPQKSVKK